MKDELRAVLSGVCLIVACNGTETGNPPVVDFGNSGCHGQNYAHTAAAQNKGVIRQSLDEPTVVPDATYKGLTCMVWDRVDAETVRILVTNYESGCASDNGWQARAVLPNEGGLDLRLQDSDCSSASCGWCLYDLSFTVRLEDAIEDEQVRLYQSGCDGTNPEKSALLPLASQPSGNVCGYANRYALAWKGGSGQSFGPCGDSTTELTSNACTGGLTCTDVSSDQGLAAGSDMRCLPTCSTNGDCNAVTSCQAGVCKPTTLGVTSSQHGTEAKSSANAPDSDPAPDASDPPDAGML